MITFIKRYAIVLVLAALASCITGCGAVMDAGDRVTLSGTPAGIQAFSDLSNGLIRTGKESRQQPSEYFAHRATQEQQETVRASKGFWQKLVE